MRVDVADVCGVQTGILYGVGHGPRRTHPAWSRQCDVIGVGRHPVAADLGKYLGSTAACVIQRLENEGCPSLSHHETVPTGVEGT